MVTLVCALRDTRDRRGGALFMKYASTSRHAIIRFYSARSLRYYPDPKRGPAIYKLWKETSDGQLKGALEMVLRHIKAYGYEWDPAARDFRKRGAAPGAEEL